MADSIVAKFGGSSVRDDRAMLRCAQIVKSFPGIKLVILSATYNTTNELELLAENALRGDATQAYEIFHDLVNRHLEFAEKLVLTDSQVEKMAEIFAQTGNLLEQIIEKKMISPQEMARLYSIGEIISSHLFLGALNLTMHNRKFKLIDATELIATDEDSFHANPDIQQINLNIKEKCLNYFAAGYTLVTQGFIGSDKNNLITTLGREGSDFSGALLAEAIGADLLQIWTDVPGIASADPRLMTNTQIIPTLSYKQAQIMASLGAKVLFPRTMEPLLRKNIPLFVGRSRLPLQSGTYIRAQKNKRGVLSLNILREVICLDIPIDQPGQLHSATEVFAGLEACAILSIRNPHFFRLVFEMTREIDERTLKAQLGDQLIYRLQSHLALVSLVGAGLLQEKIVITEHLCLLANDYQISYLCTEFNQNYWQDIHDQLILNSPDQCERSKFHL